MRRGETLPAPSETSPVFDLPQPIHPSNGVRGVPRGCPSGKTDFSHPFALTLSRRATADLMSGRAAPLVLARFATLADGKRPV